jgi:sporulation protein YlmC with PRC-barrel domain
MSEIAGWVAPIATAIAAIMTAANLGARVTGWGFVVFAVGSLAWITVAATTGQTNLLLTNGFLTLVNIVGIWRWLGRQATYEKGAHSAEIASETGGEPSLFHLGGLEGKAVTNRAGETIGHVVDAMAECESGRIAYFVVREGSEVAIAERLHMLPWEQAHVDAESISLDAAKDLSDFKEIEADQWPVRARSAR